MFLDEISIPIQLTKLSNMEELCQGHVQVAWAPIESHFPDYLLVSYNLSGV